MNRERTTGERPDPEKYGPTWPGVTYQSDWEDVFVHTDPDAFTFTREALRALTDTFQETRSLAAEAVNANAWEARRNGKQAALDALQDAQRTIEMLEEILG